MSFVATCVLVVLLIIRPQEIWPSLEAFRLLDVFTGLAAVTIIIDLATGAQRPPFRTPQLRFLAAFLLSCYVSTVIMTGRDGLATATKRATITAVFMIVVMFGVGTFARLRAMFVLLVLLAGFVSAVAVHQGQVEPVCIEMPAPEAGEILGPEDGTSDGRSCTTMMSCFKNGGRSDIDYECERIGLFRTTSVVRRVRWRGELNDPNELAVVLGASIPLLLALAAYLEKKWFYAMVALPTIGVWFYAVILTQSRGGQLVIAGVLATYFVFRFGVKGLFAAAVLALPVLLLGGRSDNGAEGSTEERIEILYDGVSLFFEHPIVGHGVGQFAESVAGHHTAHNAYLLAVTELGLPGFFFWSGLVWTSVKIPLTVVRRRVDLDPKYKPFAMGLLVSFIGMSIGIFFLSFTYKQLLFLWLGLSAALYRIVKDEDPSFEVKVGTMDYLGLLAFDVAIVVALYVYTRLKA